MEHGVVSGRHTRTEFGVYVRCIGTVAYSGMAYTVFLGTDTTVRKNAM